MRISKQNNTKISEKFKDAGVQNLNTITSVTFLPEYSEWFAIINPGILLILYISVAFCLEKREKKHSKIQEFVRQFGFLNQENDRFAYGMNL